MLMWILGIVGGVIVLLVFLCAVFAILGSRVPVEHVAAVSVRLSRPVQEVWALIALLGYLVVLHGRYAGLIKIFGLLAGAVLAFSLVVMAWYGVNFVLGAGLHSYGFGGGGQAYVYSAVVLQTLYIGASVLRATQVVTEH